MKEIIPTHKRQYLAFTLLAFLVALLTGILVFSGAPHFQPYLGKIPPLAAILIAYLLGLALFSVLLSRNWLSLYKKEHRSGWLFASGLALWLF